MFLSVLLVATALAAILGGDLRRLASLEVPRFPWIFVSLVIRFFAEDVVLESPSLPLSAAVIAASYGLLFYGLWANRRSWGMRLVALGSIANFAVIASNSFRMPVRLDLFETGVRAQEAARLAGSITHIVLDAGSRAPFLADIFAWNYFTSRPSVFSVGDVLIAVGVGWLIIETAKPRSFR